MTCMILFLWFIFLNIKYLRTKSISLFFQYILVCFSSVYPHLTLIFQKGVSTRNSCFSILGGFPIIEISSIRF